MNDGDVSVSETTLIPENPVEGGLHAAEAGFVSGTIQCLEIITQAQMSALCETIGGLFSCPSRDAVLFETAASLLSFLPCKLWLRSDGCSIAHHSWQISGFPFSSGLRALKEPSPSLQSAGQGTCRCC